MPKNEKDPLELLKTTCAEYQEHLKNETYRLLDELMPKVLHKRIGEDPNTLNHKAINEYGELPTNADLETKYKAYLKIIGIEENAMHKWEDEDRKKFLEFTSSVMPYRNFGATKTKFVLISDMMDALNENNLDAFQKQLSQRKGYLELRRGSDKSPIKSKFLRALDYFLEKLNIKPLGVTGVKVTKNMNRYFKQHQKNLAAQEQSPNKNKPK